MFQPGPQTQGSALIDLSGRDGKIRTCDPLYPKQVRYQAALRPDLRQRLAGCVRNEKSKITLLSIPMLQCPEQWLDDAAQSQHRSPESTSYRRLSQEHTEGSVRR